MERCQRCNIEKNEGQFYLGTRPHHFTYKFCMACVKIERTQSYAIALEVLRAKPYAKLTCAWCLEDKNLKDYSPSQLGQCILGFWFFCRPCAAAKGYNCTQAKKNKLIAAAELLGEPIKTRKLGKGEKANRKRRDQMAERAKIKRLENPDLVDDMENAQTLRASQLEKILGDEQYAAIFYS